MVSRKCPVCRSPSVGLSDTHIGGMGIIRTEYVCRKCSAVFVEVYEYSHTELLAGGER